MPIGRPDTDRLWDEVYRPTIEACSLNALRIDREDDGSLLPSQITQYIQASPFLIADLTYARPNCYYEVGYAMGLNKEHRLILCCREDHNSDSERFNPKVNKVHFDLQSHGILWWSETDFPKFAEELRAKLEKRKEQVARERLRAAAGPVTAGYVTKDIATLLTEKMQKAVEREERAAATWTKPN
jgi:nucleoside 2-deoxyribosyltransferase